MNNLAEIMKNYNINPKLKDKKIYNYTFTGFTLFTKQTDLLFHKKINN